MSEEKSEEQAEVQAPPKLPETIYVQQAEFDAGEFCLMTSESSEELMDLDMGFQEPGKRVGVYKLEKMVTVKKKVSVSITVDDC